MTKLKRPEFAAKQQCLAFYNDFLILKVVVENIPQEPLPQLEAALHSFQTELDSWISDENTTSDRT